jgi:hypothetical protein
MALVDLLQPEVDAKVATEHTPAGVMKELLHHNQLL